MAVSMAAAGDGAARSRAGDPPPVPVPPVPVPVPPDRVVVDIGELVLDGFPRVDHDLVAAVFQAELTRLLVERREPYRAGALLATEAGRDLDLLAGLPPLPPTTSSRRLGRELARSVHAGLTAAEVSR